MVCKAAGNIVIGVNTPPKNTMAMRTTVAGGMACGMSLKGAERSKPNAENIKEETKIPVINSGRFGKGPKGIIIIVYVRDRTIRSCSEEGGYRNKTWDSVGRVHCSAYCKRQIENHWEKQPESQVWSFEKVDFYVFLCDVDDFFQV
jgi:hypothetical protein